MVKSESISGTIGNADDSFFLGYAIGKKKGGGGGGGNEGTFFIIQNLDLVIAEFNKITWGS